jgi:transposase
MPYFKGVKQVLEERRINYSKAPGEATCKQVKMRNNANAERKRLLAEWEQDKESQVKRLLFLTYPKQEDVVHQSKAVQCFYASCVLSKEEDFKSQKSGLEEIYEKHNEEHGTNHQCKFLPKFHPELNPIERVWSRLKWYLRKYADGKLEKLQRLMVTGLQRDNVSLALIRKYCRLVTAYYYAYLDGKDIIQAESWIKKHRSHRGHSDLMDERLYKLYYPNGIQDSIEEIVQDNLVLDHSIIEYIHDNNTCDNELDEWLQMINDHQTTGRIV